MSCYYSLLRLLVSTVHVFFPLVGVPFWFTIFNFVQEILAYFCRKFSRLMVGSSHFISYAFFPFFSRLYGCLAFLCHARDLASAFGSSTAQH